MIESDGDYMAITGRDLQLEKRRLDEVLKLLDDKIAQMGKDIFDDEDKFKEFRRYTWDNMRVMDAQELNQARADSEFEANKILMKQDYFKKLYRIKDNPYFASVVFEDEELTALVSEYFTGINAILRSEKVEDDPRYRDLLFYSGFIMYSNRISKWTQCNLYK